MERGLIQIYTGDGKGKTTASIGLTARAVGQGLNCCFIFLFKDFEQHQTGERVVLKKLGVQIHNLIKRSPFFNPDVPFEDMRTDCLNALKFIEEDIFTDLNIDLLVLDEMNTALSAQFISEKEMLSFMEKKPQGMELVLTGRGVTDAIIERAELVSHINKIKHPYDLKIKSRKGMEY